MESSILLTIDGAVERPLSLGFEDLWAMPEEDRVVDVSRFHPARQGDGVSLDSLLRIARPIPEANYLTLHASRDDFHVSIPLAELRAEGIVVFRLGDERLAVAQGGPVRLIIRDPSACRSTELDDCANVKFLDRIELTVKKGRDTRPLDDVAHAALHEREKT